MPAESPFALVSLEKFNNERDITLTDSEFKRLLEVATKSKMLCLADMIKFAAITAARYSEITGLLRQNVDFNKKTATFMWTKTTPSHTIPLHDDAIAILKKYPFGDKFFDIKSRESFRHYWEKVRQEAELPTFRASEAEQYRAGWCCFINEIKEICRLVSRLWYRGGWLIASILKLHKKVS